MTHTRRVRTERWNHPSGQRLRHEAHALEHPGSREVEVDVVFKDDVDHREPEGRLRPDDANTGEALEVDGQRVGDLVLDFLRAVACPVGEDDDLVVGQVRNGIDRRAPEGPPSPSAERQVEHDDDDAIAKGRFDEAIDHERTLVTWRGGTRKAIVPDSGLPGRHTTAAVC